MIIDFEIECEEILISDDSNDENADVGESSIEHETQVTESPESPPPPSKHFSVKPVASKTVSKSISKPSSSSAHTNSTPPSKFTSVSSISKSPKSAAKQSAVASKTSISPIEVILDDDDPVPSSNDATLENTATSRSDAASGEPGIPKLHKIPVKEDTSEQARQLYSMIQSGSFQNFPVMQPASKNLVRQLLDIVKLANSRNQSASSGDENIPNTYIITTKYDDPNSTAKVRVVETSEVISTVSQTVQAIKDGTYEKNDDLVIICGSPAIFLIKNVSVKTFDPNMNSVYVITSENLISYLYLLSTKAKPSRKMPLKTPAPLPTAIKLSSTTSKTGQKNQKASFSSLANKIIPQKLLTSSPSTSSTLQEKSHLRLIAPASAPNATLPVTAATSSSVGVEIPAQLLSSAAKSVPLISQPVTLGVTPNTVTSIAAGPISGSNLIANSAGAASIMIPSKSSAFQAPKVAIAPYNAMRNNMMSLKRKMDAIHKPSSPATKESPLPKSTPLSVVTQSPALSTISIPRAVNATLNKTGPMKLTFAPALSSVSTPKTAQPLKPLQPAGKAQFVRLEPNKVSLKVDSAAQKRRISDFISIEPSAKRSTGIEDKTTDTSSKLKSVLSTPKPTETSSKLRSVFNIPKSSDSGSQLKSVLNIPAAISPVQISSPEAPSPIGDDNVASDSEEEKPLSPRAAQHLLANQRTQIRTLEQNIIKKEREILALRKKIPALKKRCLAAKKTADTKSDEQLVEEILKKYLDNDAVQFFLGQMKMSGKSFTQFRWTEEDKLFALGLLYRNPIEYNVLVQRFTLPSDKTLNKFVSRIKRAEMETGVTS